MSNEERFEALAQLKSTCEELSSKGALGAIDEEMLSSYLQQTASVPINGVHRLLFLVAYVNRAGNWPSVCTVYRYAIKMFGEQHKSETAQIYGTWANNAVDIIMHDTSRDSKGRITIAKDAELIIEEGKQVCGEDADFPLTTGCLFYYHPLRTENENEYLHKAISEFERQVQRELKDGERIS
jgi:hypothetical protein